MHLPQDLRQYNIFKGDPSAFSVPSSFFHSDDQYTTLFRIAAFTSLFSCIIALFIPSYLSLPRSYETRKIQLKYNFGNRDKIMLCACYGLAALHLIPAIHLKMDLWYEIFEHKDSLLHG